MSKYAIILLRIAVFNLNKMNTAFFGSIGGSNMAKKRYETQFSIYKVDYSRSKKFFEDEKEIKIESYSELEERILEEIKNNILKKGKNNVIDVDSTKFNGVVFKTYHYPSWYGMIEDIVNEDIDISNTHISYILTYLKDNNLFILTGGLGSNYISEFTQKNYGLYLLPKIMHDNSPAIKSVLENRMSGNRLSSKHSNRNVTTMNTENDMSSIFRELSLEIDKDIIKLLGIELDEKKNKNLNLIAKDSFVIRKSITKKNLIKVLDKLVEIEKMKDNFSLGYFVDVKKYGYSPKKLNEMLILDLMEKKFDNFVLVGDDYSEYCIGGNKYIIEDNIGNEIYQDDKPITIEDLFNNILPSKITKTSVENLLKLNIKVYNDNDIILFPTKLKQCIQGHVDDENNIPFFIFNGNWLMFDNNYLNSLDNEFKNSYKEMINIDNNLVEILTNSDSSLNEDKYNKSFDCSEDVIVAHTVLSNNIELADIIYFNDSNLYLIHNKSKFQGNGARDVLNQILTSAEFINHYLMERDKREIFEKYYDDIKEKYPNNKKINSITKKDFIDIFSKQHVFYVAGFMENLSENTDSNYAKYITLDTSKKLKEKGYDLLLFDINSKIRG